MDDGIQYISYHLLADPVMVNCYLLYTPDSKEALVIDPGENRSESGESCRCMA